MRDIVERDRDHKVLPLGCSLTTAVSSRPGLESFNALSRLACALQETSLTPDVAVVCTHFARAVRHPSAVQALWRPWALRRWPQLNVIAHTLPLAADWRTYAQRRLQLRDYASQHAVDNCFEPSCELSLDKMIRGAFGWVMSVEGVLLSHFSSLAQQSEEFRIPLHW